MSRWSDEFEKHAIHELLRQTSEWATTNIKDADAEFEAERMRLRKVLAELWNIIRGLDPEFYPQPLLDQIHNHLQHQHFYQQLQAHSTSPQIGQLQTANNHITQYAPQIYQLAAMARPVEVRDVIKQAEDAFSSFTVSMEMSDQRVKQRIEETNASLDTLNQSFSDLEGQFENVSNSADEKLSEWQTEFTEHQTTRLEEYSSAQVDREGQFNELLSGWKEAVEAQTKDITAKHSAQLGSLIGNFETKGETALKDVDEKHQAVLEIHKLVGRDSVAGGFQTSAGEEQQAADLWRNISMVALVGAIIWLAFKYWIGFEQISGGGINWAEIITASSLTAILLITAGYASKQSKMHRDNEKQFRSYALETKALDPFMANLDIDDQKKIKAELIRRMFGQQHAQMPRNVTKIDESTVKTLAESVSDTVSHTLKQVMKKDG